MSAETALTLEVYGVDRKLPAIKCDYVRLPLADDKDGRFSGSCGIKKGHAKSALALGKGCVIATENGATVFEAEISGGFALVSNNVVSVTADSLNIR